MRILLNSAHISKPMESIYIDSRDDLGCTPLSRTLQHQHRPLGSVMQVVERGASVDSRDNIGRTALTHSVSSHNGWDHGSTIPLFDGDINLEESRFLLDNGANVNSKDIYGRTLLSWLAGSYIDTHGHAEITDLLLRSGADIDSEDFRGWTPLSWATFSGSYYVVEWLLKQSARMDSRDNAGKTPFLYVTYRDVTGIQVPTNFLLH